MITFVPPYYLKNKAWYYFDPRYNRNRLTDKATKKTIDSYICQLPHTEWTESGLMISHLKTEEFLREAKEDIKDFKKLANSEEEITKKDILRFLNDLEIKIKEMEG